jgi:hypothetical protein
MPPRNIESNNAEEVTIHTANKNLKRNILRKRIERMSMSRGSAEQRDKVKEGPLTDMEVHCLTQFRKQTGPQLNSTRSRQAKQCNSQLDDMIAKNQRTKTSPATTTTVPGEAALITMVTDVQTGNVRRKLNLGIAKPPKT